MTTATFQAPVYPDAHAERLLDAWGALHGQLERLLFAAWNRSGAGDWKEVQAAKPSFCARHGLTSRQFNALITGLQGKVASRQAVDALALDEARDDRKGIQASIKRLDKLIVDGKRSSSSRSYPEQRFGKYRRLARAEARILQLVSGRARLCFGSRKLFRAQFQLEAAGFESLAQWRAAWRDARANQFFCLGSKDEASGNQTCKAVVAENGTLTLRLRLPDALIGPGAEKFLLLENVWFEHGQLELYDALDRKVAVSYRFLRDARGWRVFASTMRPDYRQPFNTTVGAIGVDINADHLALTQTDRSGNLRSWKRIPCVTYGMTDGQRRAVVLDACARAVELAAEAGMPLVHEKLDFRAKRKELGGNRLRNNRRKRQLSSFAYSAVVTGLKSAALRHGVSTVEVNPAYTSVIGRLKYATRSGVSTHLAAAHAIARRGLGLSERLPQSSNVFDDEGQPLALPLPARNRGEKEWSAWAKARRELNKALAARRQSARLARRLAKAAPGGTPALVSTGRKGRPDRLGLACGLPAAGQESPCPLSRNDRSSGELEDIPV